MAGTLLWGMPPSFAFNSTHTHFSSFSPDISFTTNHLNFHPNQQFEQGAVLQQECEDAPSFFSNFQFGLPFSRGEVEVTSNIEDHVPWERQFVPNDNGADTPDIDLPHFLLFAPHALLQSRWGMDYLKSIRNGTSTLIFPR